MGCVGEPSPLTYGDTSDVELARPGYGDIARRYLGADHRGVVVRVDGDVAAMAWYIVNTTERTVTVKGYHPLRPGYALLHAAWTHPNHRGKGLQRETIKFRAHQIASTHPFHTLEAAVSPSNIASSRNYQHLGFTASGTLYVTSWMGRAVARVGK